MTDSDGETVKMSTTAKKETQEWLRERYPDATSDSQRIIMAISDAREFERMLHENETIVIPNDSE
jgi:hypothetical protein